MANSNPWSYVTSLVLSTGLLGAFGACANLDTNESYELRVRTCPEAVTLDSRRDPRNAAGFVRYCWPGEAACFCDRDNDCYALDGYPRCAPPSPDAGTPRTDAGAPSDARVDAARDASRNARTDASNPPPPPPTPPTPPQPPQPPRAQPPTPPMPPTPPAAATPSGAGLRAFPGAEGFGAVATGGRGGRVVEVTNLNSDGAGSLADALGQSGPRTVVFRVSGVIHGTLWARDGNFTLAGQTSPGGITLDGGLICDNVYEPGFSCRNVIIRHMRFRNPAEDCIRLGGTERVILDHVSLEQAGDESLEITRSHDITVQQTLIAEPVGDHYRWGGVLINYSKDVFPLDNISIHHSVWNGVHGRLPEISCEENSDGPGRSNCAGRTLHIELTNNVMFDVFDPVWYNRCVGNNAGNDCPASSNDFFVNLNFANNVVSRRTTYGLMPAFADEVSRGTSNAAYYSGNLSYSGPVVLPIGLAIPSRSARHGFPAVTAESASGLTATLQRTAGAFPRDPMDSRVLEYLSRTVDLRPWSWTGEQGVNRGDGLRLAAPAWALPTDSDHDGMPDEWERLYGLNPGLPDGSGTALSARLTGVAGYSNLECYLNLLADSRVSSNR